MLSESTRPQSSSQPDAELSTNSCRNTQASYLGESGFMPFLNHEEQVSSSPGGGPVTIKIIQTIEPLNPVLRKSYTDIFLKHCFTFCPVMDESLLALPEYETSLAIQQSIGLIGSVIQPSLLHVDKPSVYYERARMLIQGGYEPNPLAALIAVMLFYWHAAAPPTVISMNTVWWWIGVAVRQAQELGLHREAKIGQAFRPGETIGLRRRIWWTLFARERLTAICQGRPCIINPKDCDVKDPTPTDFPNPDDPRALIFVQWVRLCSIVGRVGDHLRRNPSGSTHTVRDLLDELRNWAQNLPETLRLSFDRPMSTEHEAELYQLHFPYLSCIALLHLEKSSQPIPRATTNALLAASCTARIFENILIRGSLRFLQGMAGWYISIALLSLLQGRQVGRLQQAADEHIRVLRVALRELSHRFGSAKMYDRSIENLLNAQQRYSASGDMQAERLRSYPDESQSILPREMDARLSEQQDWSKYFPGLPSNVSPLVEILVASNQPSPFSDWGNGNDLSYLLYDIFDNPLDGITGDLSDHITGWGMSMNDRSFL
ncbi:Fungal specific transcription factor domain-containing protein [Cladophialophora immunda]|nr:Fungal specific transcription factor domain-containing protein [Cladophialophora immunda]